ncbi:MAG: DUF1846 domain-containing protein [Clostridia bacterium]|nr:DUF1846 domain-containing protein [Clostridia bacterium]
MLKKGFNNQLYVDKQRENILKRIARFDGKLYLEFGGKLFDDFHASRVLPGFEPDAKIKMLCTLREHVEIIFCISAENIEKSKIRADLGISYDMDLLRQIDLVKSMNIEVNSIVITCYSGQHAANQFMQVLDARGIKYYIHKPIPGYPHNVDYIVSDNGYGSNPYIETSKPLVVVTAPGPGSGKLATCLSQVYHESKRGITAGYGKYETFPIWNLPLKHPVNLAYEAATADLQDVNMIDPFHLEQYGETTVNYNRDVEAFPIVHRILTKITGNDKFYCSPTDMGVNMAGYGIFDEEACCEASRQEILRRYFRAASDHKQGKESAETVEKIRSIMEQLDIKAEERPVVLPARRKSNACNNVPAAAIQLPDGRVITGKATKLMSASSGAMLNSIKVLADIPKSTLLMSPAVLEPLLTLKNELLGGSQTSNSVLKADDVLSALYICAVTDPIVKRAVEQLPKLRGCEIHSTHILNSGDESILRKMRMNITTDPHFTSEKLYNV